MNKLLEILQDQTEGSDDDSVEPAWLASMTESLADEPVVPDEAVDSATPLSYADLLMRAVEAELEGSDDNDTVEPPSVAACTADLPEAIEAPTPAIKDTFDYDASRAHIENTVQVDYQGAKPHGLPPVYDSALNMWVPDNRFAILANWTDAHTIQFDGLANVYQIKLSEWHRSNNETIAIVEGYKRPQSVKDLQSNYTFTESTPLIPSSYGLSVNDRTTAVWMRCNAAGHVWKTTARNLTSYDSTCEYCSDSRTSRTLPSKDCLAITHPELVWKLNDEIDGIQYTATSREKVSITTCLDPSHVRTIQVRRFVEAQKLQPCRKPGCGGTRHIPTHTDMSSSLMYRTPISLPFIGNVDVGAFIEKLGWDIIDVINHRQAEALREEIGRWLFSRLDHVVVDSELEQEMLDEARVTIQAFLDYKFTVKDIIRNTPAELSTSDSATVELIGDTFPG